VVPPAGSNAPAVFPEPVEWSNTEISGFDRLNHHRLVHIVAGLGEAQPNHCFVKGEL